MGTISLGYAEPRGRAFPSGETLAQISDATLAWLASPATLREEVPLSQRL